MLMEPVETDFKYQIATDEQNGCEPEGQSQEIQKQVELIVPEMANGCNENML